QGGMRIFPGTLNQDADRAGLPRTDADLAEPVDRAEPIVDQPVDTMGQDGRRAVETSPEESEVVDGDVVQEIEVPSVVDGDEAPPVEKPSKRRRSTKSSRKG